jgi:hypothetical protein
VKLDAPAGADALAKVESAARDFTKEKPVSDEVFAAYRGLFEYEHRELNTRVEGRGESAGSTWEKVSFDAAYGGERVTVYLFLPRNVAPPFQAVVYFPVSDALFMDTFDPSVWASGTRAIVPRSGRVLVFPIYKGTFERRDGLKVSHKPPDVWRDHALETRPDIDRGRLAFLGESWGGVMAPLLLGVEHRFKAAVLTAGGFRTRRDLPEVEALNFVTRVSTPVLFISGRYDSWFPPEGSQLPMFRLFGTPQKDKKHLLLESGHTLPIPAQIGPTLDWFDRYLGPVRRPS